MYKRKYPLTKKRNMLTETRAFSVKANNASDKKRAELTRDTVVVTRKGATVSTSELKKIFTMHQAFRKTNPVIVAGSPATSFK